MLLKTKLLLSLGGLGVVGGTGVGVYCLKNKDVSDEKSLERQEGNDGVLPGVDGRNTLGKNPLPGEQPSGLSGSLTSEEEAKQLEAEKVKQEAEEKAKKEAEALQQAAKANLAQPS